MPPMLPRSRVGTLTIQETYEENLTAAHSLPSAVWTGLGVFEVPISIGSVELCGDPVHNWVGWVATGQSGGLCCDPVHKWVGWVAWSSKGKTGWVGHASDTGWDTVYF